MVTKGLSRFILLIKIIPVGFHVWLYPDNYNIGIIFMYFCKVPVKIESVSVASVS